MDILEKADIINQYDESIVKDVIDILYKSRWNFKDSISLLYFLMMEN